MMVEEEVGGTLRKSKEVSSQIPTDPWHDDSTCKEDGVNGGVDVGLRWGG